MWGVGAALQQRGVTRDPFVDSLATLEATIGSPYSTSAANEVDTADDRLITNSNLSLRRTDKSKSNLLAEDQELDDQNLGYKSEDAALQADSAARHLPAPTRASRKRSVEFTVSEKLSNENAETEGDVVVVEPSPSPTKRSRLTKELTAANSTLAVTRPTRKSSSKSCRTLEQILTEVRKITDNTKLLKLYPTISDFIDYLTQFERSKNVDVTKLALFGCRIVYVNPPFQNRRASSATTSIRNKMDISLRTQICHAVQNGAELIRPEDFVGSEPDWNRFDSDAEIRADAGNWTSHVIPLQLPGAPKPNFEAILKCLGPNGVSVEDLGPFVEIVSHDWVIDSVKACSPTKGWEPWSGDPRPPSTRSYHNSPTKATQTDTRPAIVHEDSGDLPQIDYSKKRDEISPFSISGDFPPDEPRDLEQIFHATRENSTAVSESAEEIFNQTSFNSDPIVDPPLTAIPRSNESAIQGLEAEFAEIEELGSEAIDEILELDEKPLEILSDRNLILSTRVDDNLTDLEEQSEREDQPRGEMYKLKNGKLRGKGQGYACDRSSTGKAQTSIGPNEAIAAVLDQLSEEADQDQWQKRGNKMAASVLRSCPYPIRTYDDAIKLHGVGDRIATKICEIARTGNHRKLQNRPDSERSLKEFQGVFGIGRITAMELYDAGARTLLDLQDPKYRLTEAQRVGLENYADLQERIPRKEVTQIFEYAKQAAAKIDRKLIIECMGSYRRGQPTCGDIDLLITRDTTDGKTHLGMIDKLWEALSAKGLLKFALSEPSSWKALDARVLGLCQLPNGGKMRRIDLFGVPYAELPAALIAYTGNDYLNRSLRLKARHLGFRLNQKGLYKNVSRAADGSKLTEGVLVACKSEEEIFRHLGVTYRPPEERNP